MSFSLVAGACCYVAFTNGIAAKNSNLQWTLNINSTGAKPAAWYDGIAGITTNVSNANSHYTFLIHKNPFFVYSGAYYLPIGEFDISTYSDYSD